MCLFEHEGKKIKLLPSQPKPKPIKLVARKKATEPNLISVNLQHEMEKVTLCNDPHC